MSLFRRNHPTPTPTATYRTVDEQRAAYVARFGTAAGMDWAFLYRQERNRTGR